MGWREVIGAVLDAEPRPARARGQQPPRHSEPHADTPTEPPERMWSGKVFDQIEWRRFEAVCEALFAQSGMRAESQSHGADGGVDIWLWSAHSDKPLIVQCKHWKKRVVGVKEVREFYGVLKSHDLTYGRTKPIPVDGYSRTTLHQTGCQWIANAPRCPWPCIWAACTSKCCTA